MILTGPTYGTTSLLPLATVTSRRSNSSRSSWILTCSGIQSVMAPVSTIAWTWTGSSLGFCGLASSTVVLMMPMAEDLHHQYLAHARLVIKAASA